MVINMKDVSIKTEYITLGQFLKFESLVGSGGEVKYFLQNNQIFLNGQAENRRGKKLYPEDILKIAKKEYRIKKP